MTNAVPISFDRAQHTLEDLSQPDYYLTCPLLRNGLQKFADAVALQMNPVDLLAPVGCHFCFVDDTWEVTLFASSTQIVGGKKDGVLRHSRFHVDLRGVIDLFSEIWSLTWQPLSLAADDELGPHLSIEGLFAEHPVWLRILARAPKRFDPGRRAIVYDATWEETW